MSELHIERRQDHADHEAVCNAIELLELIDCPAWHPEFRRLAPGAASSVGRVLCADDLAVLDAADEVMRRRPSRWSDRGLLSLREKLAEVIADHSDPAS